MPAKKRLPRNNPNAAPHKATIDTRSGPSGLVKMAEEQNLKDFADALKLADEYNNTGREAEIVSVLAPYEIRYPFAQRMVSGQFDRLLGYGYAHLKKWTEAEHHLVRGHKLFPESLDFLYALTYVHFSMRNFAAALQTAEAFESIVGGADSSLLLKKPFNKSLNQRSSLLNILGLCYQEMQSFEEADRSFRSACEVDPAAHQPYLNLAQLQIRRGESSQAFKTLELGIQKCSQVQELRMLVAGLSNKATISACLIVKNEEELLPGCLDSIRSWVDEIIVVDTGSTDRTMEIARSYGAKVHEHPWEGSFSKARNYSLQYATKDWLFIIDADERVYAEDTAQILAAVNQPDADVITTNVYNVYEEFKDVIVFLPSHRFFRRSLNIHYEGIVHNQLVVADSARYMRSSIRLKHLGYGLSREKMQAKTIRTKTLLEKQLAEDPDNAFALFNYAQLLRSTPDGFHQEYAPLILQSAGRAIELTQADNPANRHIHLMCLDQMAWTHYYLGNYDQALDYSQRALDIKPDYLDPLLLRGYLYFKRNDLPKATFYFEKYLSTQAAYDPSKEMENIILVHLNARTEALFNLGAMAEIRGEIDTSKRYYRQVLAINAEYVGANLNLGRLLLAEGHYSEAEECLQRVVEHGQATADICVKLAQLYSERGELSRAESVLRRGQKSFPYSASILEALGDLYSASGLLDKALCVQEQAWKINRDSVDLTAKLAATLVQTGRSQKAIEVYHDFGERHTLTPEMQNDLGNCYYRLHDYKLAEEAYQKALAISSKLLSARRNLGLAQAMLKKVDDAVMNLERCLTEDPGQLELHHVLGDLLVAGQKHREALAHYEKYLQKFPADVTALCRLSDCYLALGHRDSASLGFRRALQIDPSFGYAEQRLAVLTQAERSRELTALKGKD